VIGVIAGVGLAAVISSHRAGVWRESSALAVLTVVTISYFSLDSAGGSGYLGAFLAGLIVGNMERLGLAMQSTHEYEMRVFSAGTSDLVTLLVFVVLAGLGVPDIEIYASVVALAVGVTLIAQALPARRLAGRLGLLEGAPP
jgi:NhaP-type Na+/H+ and K+/H+ antiporter